MSNHPISWSSLLETSLLSFLTSTSASTTVCASYSTAMGYATLSSPASFPNISSNNSSRMTCFCHANHWSGVMFITLFPPVPGRPAAALLIVIDRTNGTTFPCPLVNFGPYERKRRRLSFKLLCVVAQLPHSPSLYAAPWPSSLSTNRR